ncbi:anti-sigma factor family protein [Streptomyces sp. NPDC002758]
MSSDVNCDKMRELGAELALGVLPGRERAEAVAHLDQCADCREYVEQLTLVGDRLIGLLPDREAPSGFEARVARRLAEDAAAHEGRTHASGPARQGLRGRVRRARLRFAAVATAFAVAFGLAGWGIGTAVETITASPPPAVETEPILLGDLTSARNQGRPVGEVYANPGTPGWIFMSVDFTGPGTPYSGQVTCLLEHRDGTTSRVGDFTVRDGHGGWAGRATVDPHALSGVRLTASDGTVLATADLETGHVVAPEQ